MANDWQPKALIALVPVAMAGLGWVFSIEARLQQVSMTQGERTPRIAKLEEDVEALRMQTGPTPQAKFVLEDHTRRLERIEARLNAFHEYLIQLPIRPPPYNGKRGSLIDDLWPRQQ